MKGIIAVIEEIAELEHWSVYGTLGVDGAPSTSPPTVVWRHVNPSDDLARFFQRAIDTFHGTIQWDFVASERNWVLKPTYVMEYARTHGLLGDLAALKELKLNDPEFGRRANAELALLAEHIANSAASAAVA